MNCQHYKCAYRRAWKDERAVSPVIATILMVAITVVLAGVLVVYMSAFSQGPGTSTTFSSLVPRIDDNPSSLTTNSGMWGVDVIKVKGPKIALYEATITLKDPSGVLIASFVPAPSGADVSYNTNLPYWYLDEYTAGSANYDEAGVVQAVSTNAANIQGAEFKTIENAFMLYLDNDGNNEFSNSDTIVLYKDYDADGSRDLENGCKVEVSSPTDIVGATILQ